MPKFSLKNKKGVSPIIATLLLIVIAVAAAVVTYSFVMGFIGTSTTNQGSQGQIVIESSVVNTNGTTTLYVRNTGAKSVNVTTVYLDGATATMTPAYSGISVGQVATILITTTITDSNSHSIKLVCADSTQVDGSVRKI